MEPLRLALTQYRPSMWSWTLLMLQRWTPRWCGAHSSSYKSTVAITTSPLFTLEQSPKSEICSSGTILWARRASIRARAQRWGFARHKY
ncbi:hypothetical protein JG688_00009265 [Phytophthora aleatoria]|uniref:Uncharacterized protein n=1 Tax=Phytophthora aleatoria TaxID=2496075 RepID=A0A8J5IRL8_9STRA|nr:hypothetical protein JG688_00009265 [Phytophthora aleatoria]